MLSVPFSASTVSHIGLTHRSPIDGTAPVTPVPGLRPSWPAPSLLSRLVRPPGVPGIEAVGVDRPGPEYGKGVGVEDTGIRDEPAWYGEEDFPPEPSKESTRSLTSFREVVRGCVRGRSAVDERKKGNEPTPTGSLSP